MPFGIIQTKGETQPPGTEYLLDNEQTRALESTDHTRLKHGTGKVSSPHATRNYLMFTAFIVRGDYFGPTTIRRLK